MLDGTNTRLVTDVTCRGHLVTCPYLYFFFWGENGKEACSGKWSYLQTVEEGKAPDGLLGFLFFFEEKAYHRCHHHYCRGNKRRPANKDRDRVTASIISDKSFCLLLGFTFTVYGLFKSSLASFRPTMPRWAWNDVARLTMKREKAVKGKGRRKKLIQGRINVLELLFSFATRHTKSPLSSVES